MPLTYGLMEWHQYQQQNPNAPIILCFGDSWLQYPVPGIGNLSNRFHDFGRQWIDIVALGENGMEIGKPGKGNLSNLTTFLQWESKTVDMIVLSGGGNDFAGADDLLPLLKHGDDGDLRSWFKPTETATLFGSIQHGYENIIHLRDTFCPDVPILTHCYDYPQVNGKGLLWFSPWIQPALNAIKMPTHMHQDAGRYIIDQLANVQLAVQKETPGYHFIDTREALAVTDWANELHPNGGGFDKIAMRFFPAFRDNFPYWIHEPKWSRHLN